MDLFITIIKKLKYNYYIIVIMKLIVKTTMSRTWTPVDTAHMCDVCEEVQATLRLTRRAFGYPTVNYLCKGDTCGNHDFFSRHIRPEEHDAAMNFFTQLNNAAAAREAAQ
jgi:hypothetical protein